MRAPPAGAAWPMARRTDKLRVHVQRSAGSAFSISEQSFATALACRPEMASFLTASFGADLAAFHRHVAGAEVLLTDNIAVCDLAALAPDLRWVQSVQAGIERLAPHIPPGVLLTNARGIDATKAGEFVIGAVIMLNGRLPRFIAQQSARCWKAIYTGTLAGKTVLILGTGNLGQAVARQAQHFGMTAIGVSRRGDARPGFDRSATPAALRELLPRADFLIAALPSTSGTRGLIGSDELDRLPASAGVINVGRADVMDYDALARKLTAGELLGAVLDVFATEPLPPDSPLWTVPNLLITPHCAIDDAASYVPNLLTLFFDNVGRYLSGQQLRNVVDLALGY